MSGTFDAIAEPLRGELIAAADAWDAAGNTERLWSRNASLWTGADEAKWLGWLSAPDDIARELTALEGFGAELRADGIRDLLLLGMGGSSLCPKSWRRRLDSSPAARTCTCSIRPTRRRSHPWNRASISHARL
jgi:hypothetical protein